MLLLVGNYTYYKFRTAVHFVTWRCTYRGCSATVLVEGNDVPPKERGTHEHAANVEKVARKRVSEKLRDELCERPSKMIQTISFSNYDLR